MDLRKNRITYTTHFQLFILNLLYSIKVLNEIKKQKKLIVSLLFIAAGFLALIYGASWLVDGASAFAKKHHISDLAIGLTIVAFGTSAPELVVNAIASFQGYSDIVLGNIIGSNNFNLFIILGLAGLIFSYQCAIFHRLARNSNFALCRSNVTYPRK